MLEQNVALIKFVGLLILEQRVSNASNLIGVRYVKVMSLRCINPCYLVIRPVPHTNGY